jgi:hypothetical protein
VHSIKNILERKKIDTQFKVWMHLKVFMNLEKTLKTLSSGQKKPKKTPKSPKTPKKTKKTHWAGVF